MVVSFESQFRIALSRSVSAFPCTVVARQHSAFVQRVGSEHGKGDTLGSKGDHGKGDAFGMSSRWQRRKHARTRTREPSPASIDIDEEFVDLEGLD